jgi:hypothetical protein
MPLIWSSVHSDANWKTPPGAPRIVRAAIAGQGWLVASQVDGGWSIAFVPDIAATDPPQDAAAQSFQAAKVGWRHRDDEPAQKPSEPPHDDAGTKKVKARR